MSDPSRDTALEEIAADPRLAAVHDYWCKLCGENDVPAFGRFDPVDLPAAVLPYLTLFDVIDGGQSFHVRLVGTGTTIAVGRNATGDDLDATMTGDLVAAAVARYRAVLEARRPVLDVVRYELPDGSGFTNRLLALPFSTSNGAIDRLLGVYGPTSLRLAKQTLRALASPGYANALRSREIV
jgi:hypothetical protein